MTKSTTRAALARLGAAAALLAFALAGCSGGQGSSAKPSPRATNPIDFPLYDGADVISARDWHQTITVKPGAADSALLAEGAGTYQGHDVVAGTQALMPSLQSWLRDLDAHPPAGYERAVTGNGVDAVRTHTRELGIDFAVFETTAGGKRRGVAVLAVDPQTLDTKAGPMLSMIGKFKLLPQSLKDSIDAQAKQQTGFTVTELTNPETPIGAAIAALDDLRTYGGRGVVLIDAVKVQ